MAASNISVLLSICMCFASVAEAVTIDMVTVGYPGNSNVRNHQGVDTGLGGVDYNYQFGKFDVTAGQYTDFLNAVAATDTYGLYNVNMDYDSNPSARGCNIKRNGTPGNYTYTVASDWANRPVNLVSWGDAARFANWLTNGQPTGVQNLSTTEDGSYLLNGAISDFDLMAVTRKTNAQYVIPTEDEWYKAASYDPNKSESGSSSLSRPNYWAFATRNDYGPSNVFDPAGTNNANYNNVYPTSTFTIGAPYWRTEVGAFTNSVSFFGTYDQVGNVRQWNESDVSGKRVLYGSSFASHGGFNHFLGSGYRISSMPSTEYDDTGFRIALVPEPATLTLLAIGGLMLTRRRCLDAPD